MPENRPIRGSPQEWLARAQGDLAEIAQHDSSRLEAQFIPMERRLWELDQFEDFLEARRRLLSKSMNEILEN